MEKIDSIWQEMEQDTSLSRGLLMRRYSPAVLPNVFLALRVPEKQRGVAAILDKSIKHDFSSISDMRDLHVEVFTDNEHADKNIFLIYLLSKQYEDIFSVLVEDLIDSISNVTSEIVLIKKLSNRFLKWKSLFDQDLQKDLSLNEQIGLFGELNFLRKLLSRNLDPHLVISSWVGPDRQIRDFQNAGCAVEVKTTHGNNHEKLNISNERQLDTSGVENLFLFHLSLSILQNSGETLNQMIDSIFELLSRDYSSLCTFNAKLVFAGYLAKRRNKYDGFGYFIRKEDYFRIEGDFPRIEEKDIRNGVGDVKYSIIVSQCSAYNIDESFVLEKLISYDRNN